MPHDINGAWRRDPRKPGSLTPLLGSKYPMIDAHLHAVSFTQETPGGQALIDAMDRANIQKAVIFGIPITKMWAEYDREPPDYYLSDDAHSYYYAYTDVLIAEMVRSLPPESRARLYPMICGFNPTDKLALRHVERLYAQYPDVWSGIGELLLRHDDLTALTYGDAARANHKALWPIYEFAAEHDLPVLLHQNISSVQHTDHPLYLWELEEALRDFPKTRFIHAHCGISRRLNVPFYYEMTRRLLDQYPQMCVDYSWVIYDTIICPGGKPAPEWIDLTEQYSDRICIGSDLVAKFERLGPELERYDVFLDELSETARANICVHTAERIYGGNIGKVKL